MLEELGPWRRLSERVVLGATLGAFLASADPAGAQSSYQIMHALVEPPSHPTSGLLEAADGNFYGVSQGGGAFDRGTIFQLRRNAGETQLTTLHSFNGRDGEHPSSGLIEGTDGALYGVTPIGGALNFGTVFKITVTGTLTTLHSFSGDDGRGPQGGLVLASDGNFYGTTGGRGTGCCDPGVLYRMTPAGALTVLHVWGSSPGDATDPSGPLIQATDGFLYGTSTGGGVDFGGTVLRSSLAGDVTVLHSFGLDGPRFPTRGVVQGSDGNFYGTAVSSAGNGPGALFSMTPEGSVTILHSFTGSDGSGPYGPLAQGTDGSFYGVTGGGGSRGRGTVFKIDTGGRFTLIHSLTYLDGDGPTEGLIRARDGHFYGTAWGGGLARRGTVFRLSAAGGLTTLTAFASDKPLHPYGALVQGSDGDLYGTSCLGGIFNLGTVFKITAAGAPSTIHSFWYLDGFCPVAGLIQGNDGHFYGTTVYGGLSGIGTVFKMSASGAVTVLHSFSGTDGSLPVAGLAQATDGQLYGTTYAGGTDGQGTIFRVSPSGGLATLHEFRGIDGLRPVDGLLQASDGDLYGVAGEGGLQGGSGYGTSFKVTLSGAFTMLHSFGTQSESLYPASRLVQASDGRFYSTSSQWVGASGNGFGSVFSMTTDGIETTLHRFAPSDGAWPYGGLLMANDGKFYGTSYGRPGGAFCVSPSGSPTVDSGYGSVFRVDPTGDFAVLHTFAFSDGACPRASPIQATDGQLYGTASMGGPGGGGVVFRMALDASSSPPRARGAGLTP